jgi:hypothetical protein
VSHSLNHNCRETYTKGKQQQEQHHIEKQRATHKNTIHELHRQTIAEKSMPQTRLVWLMNNMEVYVRY